MDITFDSIIEKFGADNVRVISSVWKDVVKLSECSIEFKQKVREAFHASRLASLDAFKVYAGMKQGHASTILEKLLSMNSFGVEGEQAIAAIILKRVNSDEEAERVLPQVIGMVQGLDAKLTVYLKHKKLIKDLQVRLKIVDTLSKEFELDDHVILTVAKVKLTRAINGDFDKTLSKGLMVEL